MNISRKERPQFCGHDRQMKILLIEEQNARLKSLRSLLSDLHEIDFVVVPSAVYSEPPRGLDAVFMTLPAAERWNPNFKLRNAQVLPSSPGAIADGYPLYIVTGVNLLPEDPSDSVSQTRIVIEEALKATRAFNAQFNNRIKSLGFWVMTLTNGVTAEELSDLLHKLLR